MIFRVIFNKLSTKGFAYFFKQTLYMKNKQTTVVFYEMTVNSQWINGKYRLIDLLFIFRMCESYNFFEKFCNSNDVKIVDLCV